MQATRTRLPAGFAGTDPPDAWPAPRIGHGLDRLLAGVEVLPGVGPVVATRLAKLGVRTVGDLVFHRPRRYEPAAPELPIAELFGDDEVVIAGEIRRVGTRRPSRRLTLIEARVADASGEIKATWFNQPWLVDKLRPGTRVRLRGQLGRFGFT